MNPVHIRVNYSMFTLFVIGFDKDIPILGCEDRALNFCQYPAPVLKQTIAVVQKSDPEATVEAFSVLSIAA